MGVGGSAAGATLTRMASQRRSRRRTEPPDQRDRVRELARPVQGVMRRLPQVERQVLELRMGLVDGHPRSLVDTARELRLSAHEAKQIEQRAFDRIREVVPLEDLQSLLEDPSSHHGGAQPPPAG